jgi:hypothetical protein
MVTSEGILGIRERFILATESNYGSAATLSTGYVPGFDVRVTPNFSQGFQEVKSAGNDVRTIEKQVAGPLGITYNLNYYPVNWRMLKYVFDIDSETGGNPYTHTLSVGNSLNSFTSEWALRHDSDPIIFQMTGNVINTFGISFSKSNGAGNDGFVNVNAGIVAQNYTTPAITAGTIVATGDPFQYRHFKLTLASGEVIEINSGEINFSEGINPSDSRYASTTLGRTIGSPIVTVFRISGRFNLNVMDTTFVDLWELAAAISGTNTIEFIKSANDKLTLTLSGVYCENVPLSGTNIEGVNSGDFVFTATGVAVVAIDSIQNW